ncbi:V-type ATP synthase subunit F [Nocardioides halotolerans]|jgi:vacuolar-type H+-ATPase subunit F/Vma7|uniref:V-type ATP synthase subunit F n=1 Tax=Nocardioides halotolerans TaxID=433660 RepID=UPI000490D19C|nr:V-type ATP synthase subunit F [Nocardioides halotolerans]
MTDVVVVTTAATASGYRLGGARTVAAVDAEDTIAAVNAAIEGGQAAVVAVHAALWSAVASQTRDTWTRRSSPLILGLPDEGSAAAEARETGLRDLLARAVGYQITFTPRDDAS